jgi:hypothetical protein
MSGEAQMIREFILQTLGSPSLVWEAIQALATLGALLFIVLELPKLKREIALHKVEGLKYATEQLQAPDFQNWSDLVLDRWKAGGDDFPSEIAGEIAAIFGRLDFVAKLIQLGFVDKSLFLYIFSANLYSLERAIANFEHRKDSQIPNIRAPHPAAYSLLKDAAKASQAKTRKAFSRLDKYTPR